MRIYGKVLGVVKNIDDPKKLRRIRVVVPEIDPVGLLGWALPCDAHKTDWLPEVDDYVWVEFRRCDTESTPIWTGLAVAKGQVDADFVTNYGSAYRKDHDANGNEIEWTADQSSQGAEAILINGTKRLATEDLLTWIKTNMLDWMQNTLIGWLKSIVCVGNLGAPAPLLPTTLAAITAIEGARVATIADYETKRAAGGDNLTDKTKAG